MRRLKLRHKRLDGLFGIAEEHAGVVEMEQFVLNAGKTGGHGSFENKHRLCFIGIDDGHAVDRA